MMIPVVLIAFLLSTADSAANVPADTAVLLKNTNGRKGAFKYQKFNCIKFSWKFDDNNDPNARRKNAHHGIEVRAGAGIPMEDGMHTPIVTGFGATIPLKQRLSLSLGLGCWKGSVREVPEKFYDGHLRAFPFLAALRFFFFRKNTIHPYALLGAGYMFCSFEMEDIITIPEIAIDQSVKNGLCFHAGFGIDVPIMRSWGAFTEATYFHREATGITTITDLNFGTRTVEFPVNLSAWIFQVGIRYFIK